MRIPTAIALTCLAVSLVLTGCKNPCEQQLENVRDRVLQFINDTKPLEEGDQPCGTDIGSDNYDQVCDFALKAINNRWPYYDCTSCDATEIKLCGCFDENSWYTDVDGNPTYPGVVYCLASVYRVRNLCECQVPEPGDPWTEDDCYDTDGNRVCAQPDRPLLNHPNLQQTDTCDAIVANFECESFDADNDGIPNQYDGAVFDSYMGQQRYAEKEADEPECINGVPTADEWDQWFSDPVSLYDGGQIFIDADGASDDKKDDGQDGDGVSSTCDNCPANANGFDCLVIQDHEDLETAIRLCDIANLSGEGRLDGKLSVDDFMQLDGSKATRCTDHLNAKAPFFGQCDNNGDGYTTVEEVAKSFQLDTDGDGFGDACDPD